MVAALASGGSVAPDAEADALLEASSQGRGPVDELVARRLRGEPLAWITGSVRFCGLRVHVDPGVFVPRLHTEALARQAAELLPDAGPRSICARGGAVAAVMRAAHPDAEVVATDVDPAAVGCARRKGIQAFEGDLDEPLPRSLRGRVDVVTAVVPYVPTEELHLLPRDVIANEPRRALDGGPGGPRCSSAPSWRPAGCSRRTAPSCSSSGATRRTRSPRRSPAPDSAGSACTVTATAGTARSRPDGGPSERTTTAAC